jgi:hypothetical protein
MLLVNAAALLLICFLLPLSAPFLLIILPCLIWPRPLAIAMPVPRHCPAPRNQCQK